jgi:rare lipoprotein A
MIRKSQSPRTTTICAEKPRSGRGAAFVWVSALAFLTYLGVAVAAGRDVGTSAILLPEDAATITTGARPAKFLGLDTRWSSALRGRASWYGAEFQGSPTASGEPFDMHALTAAHRTLPLGSRALVRNLENDRTVVVKINDRGPYRRGMALDLSYAAARQIGMDRAGSARVEITPF